MHSTEREAHTSCRPARPARLGSGGRLCALHTARVPTAWRETTARVQAPRVISSPARCRQEDQVSESVYKIIELVGTSPESWEKAAQTAVERAKVSFKV